MPVWNFDSNHIFVWFGHSFLHESPVWGDCMTRRARNIYRSEPTNDDRPATSEAHRLLYSGGSPFHAQGATSLGNSLLDIALQIHMLLTVIWGVFGGCPCRDQRLEESGLPLVEALLYSDRLPGWVKHQSLALLPRLRECGEPTLCKPFGRSLTRPSEKEGGAPI